MIGMNKETVEKIIELNKNFYSSIFDHFSATRQYPWAGWERALKTVLKEHKRQNKKKSLKVLDLACGNGRFFGFLQEELPNWRIDYTGADANEKLLKIAQRTFAKTNPNSKQDEPRAPKHTYRFLKCDVIKGIDSIEEKCDLIVAFGITHHLPSQELRNQWFESVFKLGNARGIVVLTFWNYSKDPRSENAERSIKTSTVEISENELDGGDYFLGWDNKPNVYRYVHEYSKQELDNIVEVAKRNNFELVEEYNSDGHSKNLNRYCIFVTH